MQNSKELKDQKLNKVVGGFSARVTEVPVECLKCGKTFTAIAINGSVTQALCRECRKENLLQKAVPRDK